MESALASFNPIETLNRFFPYVRVISLPSRMDYVRKTMKDMNIEYITFSAILGKTLNLKDLITKGTLDRKHKFKNRNEIACALSHLEVLREFLMHPEYDRIFIFEDDVVAEPGYYRKVEKVMKAAPPGWEFINFGRCYDNCEESSPISDTLLVSKSTLCSHSYAVTQSGAKKILKYAFPMKIAVDNYYVKLMEDRPFGMYTATPRIFNQLKGLKTTSKTTTAQVSSLGNNTGCPECNEPIHWNHIFFYAVTLTILSLVGYYQFKKGK